MSDTSPKDAVKAVAKIETINGSPKSFVYTGAIFDLPDGEHLLVPISALSQVRNQALLEAANACTVLVKRPPSHGEGFVDSWQPMTALECTDAIRKLAEE